MKEIRMSLAVFWGKCLNTSSVCLLLIWHQRLNCRHQERDIDWKQEQNRFKAESRITQTKLAMATVISNFSTAFRLPCQIPSSRRFIFKALRPNSNYVLAAKLRASSATIIDIVSVPPLSFCMTQYIILDYSYASYR